jgi:hypothetical protein
MYGQIIAMEHTLTADNRIRESVQTADPEEIWLDALSKAERMFRLLEQRYSVTAADFYHFLQQHELKLYEAIAKAWEALDSDIAGRYENGRMTPQQWQQWRQSVQIWKRLLSAGVQLFRVHLLNPDQTDVVLEWPKAA